MADYREGPGNTVVRVADRCSIPRDERNVAYMDFLRWQEAGGVVDPYIPPTPIAAIMAQDLMAQFTSADLLKIKAAVDTDIQFWGLWSALQAKSEPMVVTNARFMAGWSALIQVLGADRMSQIATALGVTIGGN